MKKELREVALDAELTLSDGTPVRLGLAALGQTNEALDKYKKPCD